MVVLDERGNFGEDVVVGGDGQCDSPGFNAKNLCYFLVEAQTNYIIDIEVLDKRHVGLTSTNMEKEAVKKGLNFITKRLNVVEFVTDASTLIIAFIDMLHYVLNLYRAAVGENHPHSLCRNLYSRLQVAYCTLYSGIISYFCYYSISEREYKDIVHSLDVWHKSKSIKNALQRYDFSKQIYKY